MATITFRGDAAPPTKQVSTITVGGTWLTGETASITMNGRSVTVTLGATVTVAHVCDALRAAFNGDAIVGDETRNTTGNLIPEFNEITATDTNTTVVLTHDTNGVPFTATVSETSTSGTVSIATTTAAVGPSILAAGNLSGGALPSASDILVFEDNSVDLLYGLDAATNLLAELHIKASSTGLIGLSRFNANSYAEYRTREFTVESTLVTIGAGEGDGSGRLLLNLGNDQTAVVVYKTDTSEDEGYHALRIRGTHASNVLRVLGSSTVDIACEAGHTATFATLIVGGSSKVRTSAGTTLGTVIVEGSAELTIDSVAALADITAITIRDTAKVILTGDNAITAFEIQGQGTFDDRGSGTITTLQVGPSANYTTRYSAVATGARVITTTQIASGSGEFYDANKKCTFTNAIDLGMGGLSGRPNLNLGDEIDIQRS